MRQLLNQLYRAMITFNEGDPARIQHLTKVHSYAKLIGELEHLDQEVLYTLEVAALVHDIGIRPAEAQYGRCNGKLQEEIGPAYAKKLLVEIGFDDERVERVCYLVAHHHTYVEVDGVDYQILLEADFLVNLYEESAENITKRTENSKQAVNTALEHIFKTESGIGICREMFGIEYM